MYQYNTLIFDLDDTLIDTSRLLVPQAAQNACIAMIEAGLNCSLEECIIERKWAANNLQPTEVYTYIANKFGPNSSNKDEIARAGYNVFYNPEVPVYLPLSKSTEKTLQQLKKRYTLYLVTIGEPETQRKKVKSAALDSYFKEIAYVNLKENKNKLDAYKNIIKKEKAPAKMVLSIGDKLSQDIRLAKQLGADACLIKQGEHQSEKPTDPYDKPDFVITHIEELITKCNL